MLRAHGLRAGYSSTDGLFIDGERVEAGDYSGPVGAHRVARCAVQAAVLKRARRPAAARWWRTMRASPWSPTSAPTISANTAHTLDDIAAVKLVVAKSLAADGLLN